MSKPFHHINYSFEDIERYLQGKMPPVEMHALEKAALQDPFLADAIDGYEASDLSAVESDLAEIKSRLLKAEEDTKVVPLRAQKQWWKAAAMIIVIAGAGTLGWKLIFDQPLQKESAAVANVATQRKDSLADQTQSQAATKPAETGILLSELSKTGKQKNNGADAKKTNTGSKTKADRIFEINNDVQQEALVASSGAVSSGLRLTPVSPYSTEANTANKERIDDILQGKVAGVVVLNNKNLVVPDVFTNKPAPPDFISIAKKDSKRIDSIMATAKLTRLGGNANMQQQKAALTGAQASVYPSLASESFMLSLTNGSVAALSSVSNLTTTGEITAGLFKPSPASLDEVVITSKRAKTITSISGAVAKTEERNDATTNRDFKTFSGLYKKPESMLVLPSGGWENFKAELRSTIRRFKKDEAVVFGDVEVKLELDKKGRAKEATIIKSYDPSVNGLVIKAVKKHKRWEALVDPAQLPQSAVITIQL